jgi:tetraacyldisaccharide 4'-kinase
MKIYKPKFWDKKNSILSIILMPITVIIIFITYLKRKITYTSSFRIPVICIGNIYIGGTGKTPLSILIAKELSSKSKNPSIIRKFYKNHIDEHNLIKAHYDKLILSSNRFDGITEAEKKKFDSVILDDGFQDCSVKKNLNIICFNQNQLIGNGLVIPSGPLRENLSSLKEAHIVVINGKKIVEFEEKILKINNNLKIYYSEYKPTNIDEFKNKELLAIAGIGNPHNFFNLLSNNNLNVKKKFIFPDHYKFKKSEFTNIIEEAEKNNYKIIMTEKDYYKIKNFNFKEINYLKLKLEVKNLDDLLERILKLYV